MSHRSSAIERIRLSLFVGVIAWPALIQTLGAQSTYDVWTTHGPDKGVAVNLFAIDPRSGQLTYVGHQPSGGKTPRSFGIDPTGSYLLSANQDSDSIVVMRIDRETGKLTPTGQTVEVGMPVCVVIDQSVSLVPLNVSLWFELKL